MNIFMPRLSCLFPNLSLNESSDVIGADIIVEGLSHSSVTKKCDVNWQQFDCLEQRSLVTLQLTNTFLYNQSLHTGPYHSSFEIWTYDIDIFDKNSNNFWEFCGDTQSVASSSAIRLCLVGKPLFRLLTSQSNLWPHELWTPHMPHQHPRCHPASHRWHPWYVLYPTDYAHCLLYFFCGGYVISFCWISGVSLSISFRVASLALGQSYDCPSASEATPKDMGIDQC